MSAGADVEGPQGERASGSRPDPRRLASHALVCTLVLYAALRSVAPVDPTAPGGASANVLRELAALSHATFLGAALGLFSTLVTRASRRDGAFAPLTWALTGLLACAAYVDSRFLIFFGRHAYHPVTLELLFSPGSSDHSGVGMGRAALWLSSWIAGTVGLGLVGRALRARALGPTWLVWPMAALLFVNAARDNAPIEALGATAPWLERFRSSLFLRALMLGRTGTEGEELAPTYPLGPLGPPASGERPDVLLVVIESLRADALDEETMPALSRHASSERALVAERHYAGANCTANSFFTLLYGTNGSMFVHFNDTARPVASAPLAWLRESGYSLAFYTSQRLEWRRMDALFVRPAFDRVIEETDGEVWERDARLIDRYFEESGGPEQPRFSVIFFTSSHHDYSFPEDRAPFQPSLRPLDVMQTDLRPFRQELVNRYRNSVSYVDSLVGELLDRLAREGRLDSTRVIITGDHGEEFLEHGHLTHASSLVEEQIHVPLVALGVPGLSGRTRELTSHEQIVPTLLASIAPGLAFGNVGTGTPMLGTGAMPIVSECADVPGMFVAIDDARKHWFTAETSSIRLDFVTDVHDVMIEDGVTPPETVGRIRAEIGHFGDARTFGGELWPCPSVLAGGERFYVCDRWIAWTEAEELCESHGLSLATFVDREQNDVVARAATSSHHPLVWMGLTDTESEGDFRWRDGSAPAFTHWADGEPSNTSGREHCVQVGRDGAWADRLCEERERFVCGPAARASAP